MDENFDLNMFIEDFCREEKERLESQAERLRKNPMCEHCSRYFLGCCACENV